MTAARSGLTLRQRPALGGGRSGAVLAAAYAGQPPPADLPTSPKIPKVRIGFSGVGGMGSVHVRNLLGGGEGLTGDGDPGGLRDPRR